MPNAASFLRVALVCERRDWAFRLCLYCALNLALFIVIASALLLFGQVPGTAEFVVTVLSLIVGLIFLTIIIVLIKRTIK